LKNDITQSSILNFKSFHIKHGHNNQHQISEIPIKSVNNYRKTKFFLYSILTVNVVSLGYYYFVLDSKQQRKLDILIKSIGRAYRSFKTGAAIGIDYKWSLWGLNEVIILILFKYT
jgi:hypothetical protein